MVDIVSILQSHERVNIEVKAAKGGIPNSIWETYSSFANTFGGTIILGIEEDKVTKEFIPCGVVNPQQMLSDIWNTLNNSQKNQHQYPSGASCIQFGIQRNALHHNGGSARGSPRQTCICRSGYVQGYLPQKP